MLDVNLLKQFAEKWLAENDYFLVSAHVSPQNDAIIEIEANRGPVDIDICENLSRAVYDNFDRDADDFSLEVGSAGITSPFKVKQQYIKAIGHDVEVLASDGIKHRGVLDSVDDDSITIIEPKKVKIEGKKRPEIIQSPSCFKLDNIKYTKYLLDF